MSGTKGVVRRALKYGVLPLSLLAAGGVVWQASYAAFSATTSNAGNNWTAGTVTLTDDDAGTARFVGTNIVPAQTDTKCITVSTTSNVLGVVKMYLASKTVTPPTTGTLDQYLKFTVKQGTGGSFTADTTGGTIVNSQSLAAIAAANTSYANGAGSWTTTSTTGESKTYQIQWTFDTTGLTQSQVDALQAQAASVNFVWEMQNS
jgi:hypothetical protein